MALQIWLPLNKDTRNNGLDNSILVNTVNFSLSSEKSVVGTKSGKFSGTNPQLYFSPVANIINGKQNFSIALWAYQLKSANQLLFAFLKSYFAFALWDNGLFVRTQATGDNGNSTIAPQRLIDLPTTNINKWTHYVCTFDKGTCKVYIDGNFHGSGHTTNNDSMLTTLDKAYVGHWNSSYPFSGYIEDFRVYDNTVTEEDVKRIYNCKIMDIVATSHNNGFFYDNSGLLINKLASTGVTYSGNSMYFNNSSSRIMSNGNPSGLNISGGTLSIWFTPLTKPNTLILYKDSASRMALGFYYNGNEFIVATDTSKQCYPTSNIVTGQINHVIVSYNQSYTPQYCIVNGVTTTATSHINYWSGTSPLAIQANGNYISKVTVYRNQLTEDEAKQLYAIGPQDKILPDEYEELEYIQSTGTQWIDTNHIWQSINRKVECKINITSHTSKSHIFASTSNTNGTDYWDLNPYSSGNNNYMTYIDRTYYGTISLQINKDYVLDYNLSGNTIFTTYNGTSINQLSVPTIPNAVNSVYIFHVNGASNYNPLKGKLYYFKMFDNGVMVRNFIPAKRKSDNVIGMYDIITQTFFTNAGTGTFTAGPAI
jgi:hypothetical protein